MQTKQNVVEQLLSGSGVRINGDQPWDIRVHDERFYGRVLQDGSLGLGEAYMEGWWDCGRIDELVRRLLADNLAERIRGDLRAVLFYLTARLFNLQSPSRAGIIARRHYDLGNDLFFAFLDPHNQYRCAYFKGTEDLAEAQEMKLDLICRKLDLKPQDRLLDIGCGWGGLARWAAERHGCEVTAVNISREQIQYARDYCRNLPVTILDKDYRKIDGTFDKIVSVGMFEHVGMKNYRTFMEVAERCLKKGGLFLLHTIGSNASKVNGDRWINRYIFPNGMLPSLDQISKAAQGLFVIEDVQNLGTHYQKTLQSWNERFQKAWPGLSKTYDRTFKRMWEFYLMACAGAFAARHIQVWQIVMSNARAQLPQCRFA